MRSESQSLSSATPPTITVSDPLSVDPSLSTVEPRIVLGNPAPSHLFNHDLVPATCQEHLASDTPVAIAPHGGNERKDAPVLHSDKEHLQCCTHYHVPLATDPTLALFARVAGLDPEQPCTVRVQPMSASHQQQLRQLEKSPTPDSAIAEVLSTTTHEAWTLPMLRRALILKLKLQLGFKSHTRSQAPRTSNTAAMVKTWTDLMSESVMRHHFCKDISGPPLANSGLKADGHWNLHRTYCSQCQQFPAAWDEYRPFNVNNSCYISTLVAWIWHGYLPPFATEPPAARAPNCPSMAIAIEGVTREMHAMIARQVVSRGGDVHTVSPMLNVIKDKEVAEALECLRAAGVQVPQSALNSPDAINQLLSDYPDIGCSFPELKYRPCLNGATFLNPCLPHWPFQYQGLDEAVHLLKPGYYAAKCDLKSCYTQIAFHLAARPYFGLEFEDVVRRFDYIIFGTSDAPAACNTLTGLIGEILRAQGVPCVIMTDDLLIVGSTKAECANNLDEALTILAQLGWVENTKKRELPSQQFVFLGVQFDTVAQTMSISGIRLRVELARLARILNPDLTPTKKQLQSLAGRLEWIASVMPEGRLYISNLYPLINTLAKPHYVTSIPNHVRDDLLWWHNRISHALDSDAPSWTRIYHSGPPTIARTISDASGSHGYGLVCGNRIFTGEWTPSASDESIAAKELIPLLIALRAMGPSLRNQVLVYTTDNASMALAVTKGSSTNPHINAILRAIWAEADTFNIGLLGDHVRREYNTLADFLSKGHAYPDVASVPLLLSH
jgi:hypothetical protein